MKLERKTASGIILMLLVMAVSTSMFNSHLVKATPAVTITIKANGDVDPTDAPIGRDGDVYNFTGDITYPTYYGILVNRGNIIIDGAGHVVEGNETGNGFELNGVGNVTIRNTNIKSFDHGIHLRSAFDNKISGNNITNNNYGIGFYSSSNYNSILGNDITNNNYGIGLFSSSNHNSFSGNNIINNNDFGLGLFFSSSNTLSGNVLNGNRYGLHIGGEKLSHFMHSIDVSNFVDGKSIYYLVNQEDSVINPTTYPEIGYLALVNSRNITVEGLTLTNKRQGLLLAFTNNSRITDNTITSNHFGIWLFSSSNNIFSGNNITDNEQNGISHGYSLYNSIFENHLTRNGVGISLDESSHNSIFGNDITANNYDGIVFDSSNYNDISGNNIAANNYYGIALYSSSDYNSIFGNNITSNGVGIELDESSNNRFFHNNFVDNTVEQVEIFISGYANFWDDDYPSGGNYWSDYEQRYPDANERDNSGIWDTPYFIDEDNQDNYPLMEPYSPPALYTLTILSSPIGGVTLTVDNISRTTPWSRTYNESISVSLEMPETHDGYHWSHWLKDEEPNRIRSVTMDRDITLTGVFVDITPPTISIHFPGNRTYTESNVPLLFIVSESTSWIGYSLDNQMNVTIYGNTTMSDLSNRIHSLTVYANDTAGNMGSSDIVYFTVDTSIPDTFPPTVLILSPKNKTYTTTDVPLTVIVDETVTWMTYSLDDQANMTYSETATLYGLSNGLHRLIAYANDTAGNIGSSDTVYFTVDTVPPNIEIISPENKTYTTSSVSLSFTLSEPISWIGYSLDGQANVTIAGNTTLSDLFDGSHSLIVYATDTVGNTGASETIYFTVNTQQRPSPFPTWIVAIIVIVIAGAFGTAVYLLKIRKKS